MNRRLAIALACMAVALGGCATSLATNDSAPSSDGSALANTAAPAPLAPNVFLPSANHYFGSMGP
jgi:hypothetical protein